MDWDNKIIMKLDATDISGIISGCRGNQFPVKLFHKSEGSNSSSALTIEAGERSGTFKWFISKTANENKMYGNIYLDSKDMFLMFTMMEAALPVISGWV